MTNLRIINPIKLEKISLGEHSSLEIPFFSESDLPPFFCARYARFSSYFLFGNSFPIANAWDMRNKERVNHFNINHDFFKSKNHKHKIIPGSLIGIYAPDSRYDKEDRKYTHLSLYLGEKNNQPLFLEQFCSEIRLMSLRDYELDKLNIQEILTLKPLVVPKKIKSST